MLPFLLGGLGKRGFGGALGLAGGGLGAGGKRKRRRTRGLSAKQRSDVGYIAASVGKTAAAEYIRGVLR